MTYIGKAQYDNQVMVYDLSDGYWSPNLSSNLSSLSDVLNKNNYSGGKDITISAGDKISYPDGYITQDTGGIKINGQTNLNLSIGNINRLSMTSTSGVFNFGSNDVSILDGAVNGQTSLNLSVASTSRLSLSGSSGTFNFGSNDVSISDGTVSGQTSLNLSTGGTSRLALTSTKGTFNFGSDDVEIGNNYISMAATTVTSGQIRVKGQDGYVAMATRYSTDSLDRRIFSFYGSNLRLGDFGSASTEDFPKILIDATDKVSIAIGSRTGENANTGLEISSTSVDVKNPLTVSGNFLLGSTPAETGIFRTTYGTDLNSRNYENDDDCIIISTTDSTGTLYFGPSNYLRDPEDSGSGVTILRAPLETRMVIGTTTILGALSDKINFERPITVSSGSTLYISSGEITVSRTYHMIDVEDPGVGPFPKTDNLDTILGGTDGQILIIRTTNFDRRVNLTQSGNISFNFSQTYLYLGDPNAIAILMYSSAISKWLVVSPAYGYSFVP